MPVDVHKISFGYKYSLTNSEKIGPLSSSQLVHQQKFGQQSDFLGNEYVFREMKCTCTNVSGKNESYFTFKQEFISMCCTPDSII